MKIFHRYCNCDWKKYPGQSIFSAIYAMVTPPFKILSRSGGPSHFWENDRSVDQQLPKTFTKKWSLKPSAPP